ncbi:hypothetical protein M0802_009795 [Mischocyttarus mexicanus]|nr:hypothetical protein M0802_009795 [Mischocyttarus mexicanus]
MVVGLDRDRAQPKSPLHSVPRKPNAKRLSVGGETPQKPSFAVLKSIPCLPVNLSLMADQVTADDTAVLLPDSLPPPPPPPIPPTPNPDPVLLQPSPPTPPTPYPHPSSPEPPFS